MYNTYRFCILVGVFAHGDIYRVIKSNPSDPIDQSPLILRGMKTYVHDLALSLDTMRLVCAQCISLLISMSIT